MAGLTQKKIKDSYKSLLRVDDDTNGIDGSLANITDGEGTAGPFQISSTEVSFPSSSTLSLVNLKAESATQGFHINLTDSNGDDKNKISIPDNVDTAFSIKESGNLYMKFTTTNGSEIVEFGKDVEMQGNLQVNGTIVGSSINFNSVDMTNVDIDSGAIDGTPIGDNSASTGAFTTLTATKALSSDTQTTPETILTLGAKYTSTGADGGAGSGSRIEFQIPDDETNPITGTAIAGIKESADDSDASAGMAFYVSQNDTNLDEVVRIDHDGNLLVGKTSGTSGNLIETNGRISAGAGSSGQPTFNCEGDTNTGINLPESDRIQFITGGSEAVRIDSSQRVGIGTTSPSSYNSNTNNLVIRDSGSGGITISTGASSTGYLAFNDGEDTTIEGLIAYNQSNDTMSFRTASVDDRLVIDGSGNVGIGTSPSAPLHVSGSAILQNDSSTLNFYNTAGAQRAFLQLSSTGLIIDTDSFLEFKPNNSTAMYINSSGKVGIGTTSPSEVLQVNHSASDGDSGILIVNESTSIANDTFLGGIGFDSADGNVPSTVGEASAAIVARSAEAHGTGDKGGNLLFLTSAIDDDDDTGSHERMRITSEGKVGIGTTSPSATLHTAHSSSTAYNGGAEILESVIIQNTNGSDDSGVNNVASLGLQVASGATSQGFINYVRTGNNTGDFTFSQRTGSSSYAEAMRITSGGKVGIGTTFGENIASVGDGNLTVRSSDQSNHYNMVNVWQHSNTTTNIEQRIGWAFGDDGGAENAFGFAGYVGVGKEDAWNVDSARDSYMSFATAENNTVSEKMRITSGGKVGIGTTSPTDVKGLHIKSDEDSDFPLLKLESDSTVRDASIVLINDGGNTFTIGIDASDSDKFKISDNFQVGTNDRLVIDSSGNIGIGETNPSRKLVISETESEACAVLYNSRNPSSSPPYILDLKFGYTPDNTTSYFVKGEDNGIGTPATEFHIYSDGSFVQTSDRRKKENIVDSENQLDKINQLRVRDYNKINDSSKKKHIGFIAQELQEVFPHLVIEADDEMKSLQIYKIGIVPLLVKAVQELSAKVEALENA